MYSTPDSPKVKRCAECGCEFERTGTRGPIPLYCPSCRTRRERDRALVETCPKCGGSMQRGSSQCKRCSEKPGARVRIEPKACQVCGRMYQPKVRTQRYCGRGECVHIGRQRTKEERAGYPNWYICLYCGEPYKAKHKSRDTFCCREHYFAWVQENPILGPYPATPTELRRCEVCGSQASSATSKTCGSDECKRTMYLVKAAAASSRDRHPRACKECGEIFTPEYGNKRRHYCSDACMLKQGRRIGKATRKARIRNAAGVESIDPIAVLRRDGWRCRLCGCKTPKRLRGTTDDRAPEVDHIVPLALGGTHTYSNVQCLCRKCNGVKGATVAGQLPLV